MNSIVGIVVNTYLENWMALKYRIASTQYLKSLNLVPFIFLHAEHESHLKHHAELLA
jgi:hypothetical protein